MTQRRTPESRAAALEAQTARVRKRYKTNTKRKRKFNFDGEEALIIDMVVMLKIANYTHTQIASIVGISRGQVGAFLQDGNVQKKLIKLQAALPQAAQELGRAFLIEAVAAVVHVMRTSRDEAVILKAASEIFDRFGIPKVSRSEVKDETPGHPLAGETTIMDKLRSASPEIQIKAAELQEMFEEGLQTLLSQNVQGVPDGNS